MAENLIATQPLFIGRARAANPGDVVPAENVEKYGWQDGVAKEGTKAAREAVAAETESATTTTATTSSGSGKK